MKPHPFVNNPPKTEAELAERLAAAMAKLPRIAPPSRESDSAAPNGESPRPQGPGSVLAGLFKSLGFKQDGGCGCAEMQIKMNAWGVEGCREHQDEILDFLETKAKAQGIPFARLAAKVALETALLKAKGLT
jgi:hypothetical protein